MTPITPEQAQGLLNTLIEKAVFSHRVDILGFTAPEYYALKALLQSAARHAEIEAAAEEMAVALRTCERERSDGHWFNESKVDEALARYRKSREAGG